MIRNDYKIKDTYVQSRDCCVACKYKLLLYKCKIINTREKRRRKNGGEKKGFTIQKTEITK